MSEISKIQGKLLIYGGTTGGAGNVQEWYDSNSLPITNLTDEGWLGLGTSSPAGLLDISKTLSGTPSAIGQYLSLSASIFTDNITAISGTAGTMVFNSIAAPTLAATNTTVTTTKASTLYIGGAPIEGTNQTITNAYSLYINSGNAYFGGNVGIGTDNPSEALDIAGNIGFTNNIVQKGTSPEMDINPFNRLRIGRRTNSASFGVIILKGDDSGTINHAFNGTTDSYVCRDNSNFGIGVINPNTRLDVQGGQTVKITTVNVATYDLLITDYILNVIYPTTAATSLTIPTAQITAGRIIIIKDASGNAGTNNITINTEGSEKIDGSTTFVISANYEKVTLYSDGSNLFII